MKRRKFPVEGAFSVLDFVQRYDLDEGGSLDKRIFLNHFIKTNKIAKSWALADARRRVTEALRRSRFPRSLRVSSIKFVETDSNNISHATAYFDVTFSGSSRLIDKIEEAFKSSEA